MKYIIEHLEEEVYDWCVLEYKHISQIVGKENLIFTNVKNQRWKLEGLGEVMKESVKDIQFENSLILDPNAEIPLHPEDKEFGHLIFGGILGDYPPRKRTEKELSVHLNIEKRNLGSKQMSTDTAVYVAKKIIDGKKLEEIQFKDEIELDLGEKESVQLPFRYVIEDGEIVLPPGFVDFMRERDEF